MLSESNKALLLSIIKYISVILFSFIFLWLFSFWTTPRLWNYYGCDASFFTMAGRGILNGWVPYKDFFDLKGPYFFFIQALSQIISKGRTGAFVLQVISLSLSIILIDKLCKLFIDSKKTAVVLFIFLFSHISTLWGGNTLEEFFLPLSLLCVYLVCKDYIENCEYKINTSTALIIGISFGIILFAKVTVASPIAGIVLATIIIYLKDKKGKELFFFLLYSFLGILIAAVPIFAYFSYHNAISDMLYSVFIFAFKRSIDYGTRITLKWELKISGCYFALVFAFCQLLNTKPFIAIINKIKKTDNNEIITSYDETDGNWPLYALLFCIALTTAICFHFGEPFIYYFTTAYPCITLALILLLDKYDPLTLLKSWRLDIPVVAFLIFAIYFGSFSGGPIETVLYDSESSFHNDYYNNSLDIGALIPQCDRDSVYSFNLDMQWFEINNILPCHPYIINLQFFVALDENIETEIISYLRKTPPKWIVVGGDLSSYLPNINDVVESKYDPIYDNNVGTLYLLKNTNLD